MTDLADQNTERVGADLVVVTVAADQARAFLLRQPATFARSQTWSALGAVNPVRTPT
jgi:hypothetical protein